MTLLRIFTSILLTIFCQAADAQTETFSRYFNGLTQAATPLSVEPMIVLQGGLARQTPVTNLGALIGSIATGTSNQIPFYQGSGNTLMPTSTLPLGFDLTGGMQTHDLLPNGTASPVWNRAGVVISGSQTNCGGAGSVGQMGTLYDSNPQILTGYPNVFKMWFQTTSNFTEYAESADGIHWVCYTGNPVAANSWSYLHSAVKSGSTYFLYMVNNSTGNVDQLSSSNGLSFSVAHANVLLKNTQGWEGTAQIVNPFVWMDDATHWNMIYTTLAAVGGGFPEGLATSSDGVTWTKYAGNPVITDTTGGPYVQKIGTTWYQWTQKNNSDIFLYTTTDLHSWTGGVRCVFCRSSVDEKGQVADPSIVTVGNQVFMYYNAVNSIPPNLAENKLAIANMSLSQVVTTQQGDQLIVPAGMSVPFQVGVGAGDGGSHIDIIHGGSINGGTFTQGTIGWNAFVDFFTGQPTREISGKPGAYWQFTNSANVNTSTSINLLMFGTTGNPFYVFNADIASGGGVNNINLFGHVCVGDTAPGSCTLSIANLGTIGTNTTRLGIGANGGFTTGITLGIGHEMLATSSANMPAASGAALIWDDSSSGRPMFNYNNSVNYTVPAVVSQGTANLGTTGVPSGTCAAAVTVSATNAAVTDTISWSFNAAPGSGWPSLTIQNYPTVNNVNFSVCNPSASTVTPAAATLNWSVIR